MSLLDIILLSISLGIDCFTVSVVCGAIERRWLWSVAMRSSVLFGLFQALMPLAGWLALHFYAARLEAYGRWVAFVLLAFVGMRMIIEAFRSSDEHSFIRPRKLTTQLLLAVATSIDALAVGASMAVTGYMSLSSLVLPLTLIGIGSLLMSLLGHWLGIRFGSMASRHFRPELFGGIILIAIGVKVLIG